MGMLLFFLQPTATAWGAALSSKKRIPLGTTSFTAPGTSCIFTYLAKMASPSMFTTFSSSKLISTLSVRRWVIYSG